MYWIIEAILLGISLSMDAFAVGLTNGLEEPNMNKKKLILIALTFGIFQGLMPLIGYLLCLPFEKYLTKIIPIVGFTILTILAINMFVEAYKDRHVNLEEKDDDEEKEIKNLTFKKLIFEAIATSIDALLVGLLFIEKEPYVAYISFSIFVVVTFSLSILAVFIGKKFGEKFQAHAKILGGIILGGIAIKTLIEYIIKING